MRKKLKRLLAMVMVVSMTMSLLSGMASAAEETSDIKPSGIQIVEKGGKIYYLADPQEGDVAGEDNFDVWTSKTIAGTENEDEFEVTLQVGTTMKAIPNDVAVVLVMDVSGSMMMDEDGTLWYNNDMPDDKRPRIDYAREAASEFAETYVENSGNAQRMLSVVQFGNNATTVLPWTNVNDGGELKESAKEAIESVEVNFLIEGNKDYWDEEQALTDFGEIDYWDASEVSAEMKDEFKDYFQSYCQPAVMTDYFRSYYETVQQEVDGTMSDVSVCTYDGCSNEMAGHTHCGYEGCVQADFHKHCGEETCAETADHVHCSKCEVTTEHKHCGYEGCDNTEEHKHCGYEGCSVKETHTHCKRCGLTTEDHTHVVGCTLEKCQDPYVGPHTHCCVHGGDSMDPYYCIHSRWNHEYPYRCGNPDPNHTHDLRDADRYCLVTDKYFGAVWNVGTNMEGGLMLARNLVNAGLADGGAIEGIDDVYVILLSDGNPTWVTIESSTTELEFLKGEKDLTSNSKWAAIEEIVSSGEEGDTAIAEDIKAQAELCAILYGASLNNKLGGNHELSNVTGAEWFKGTGKNYVGADLVVDSPESDGIEEAFLSINKRIDILAKAWTVGDELSDDVTFLDFVENGAYATVTPASGSKNAAISWSLGDMEPEVVGEGPEGSVNNPYIYTLKYKVKLNSAQDNVKAVSLAHDADSSPEGIWTGTNAKLQYFMIDKEQLDTMTPEEIEEKLRRATFEDVSVKGIYGDFTFIKKNGKTDEVMEGVGFTLFDSENSAYGAEVFSDSEGKVTFTDIPRGEYTLKETTVPKGMQQMSDLDLKVSWGEVTCNGQPLSDIIQNWPVTVKVEGKKTWNDNNNYDGLRPESITINLLADGTKVDSKTVTAANDWKWSFTDLDKYKDGKEIEYTITEDTVEGYETKVKGYDVTNTHKVEKVAEISGKKTWVDNNDQDGLRPESITINLLANGEKVQSKTVTAADGWKWSFTDLDMYKNGEKIEYTITEEKVDKYTSEVNGYNVTNTHTPETVDVEGKKTWDDANNQDGKRPESITIHLWADGKEIGEKVVTAKENWQWSWTGLDKYKGGKEIAYTITEDAVDGYTSEVNGYNVTNTHTVEKVAEISGKKTWDDANNQDGKRPESITINLFANGEKVGSKTVTAADGWKWSFTGLPKNEGGKAITYTITEDAVPGYSAEVKGYDVINSYTPGKTSVTVNKVWKDDSNRDGIRPTSISVQLLADGAAKGEPVTLTAEDGWTYTWNGLDQMSGGKAITYTVAEVGTVAGYTSSVNGFTITNTHEIEKTSVSGSKTWNDNNDQDGKRPESITINLFANGEKVGSKTVTAADGWKWSFTGLPKNEGGKAITYTITEDTVPGYSTEVKGYDVINSYTPGKTSVTVKKEWNDDGNRDGIRPVSISVQLLANGTAKGEPVTLTAEDGWTYTWNGLDQMSGGKTISYSVAEVGAVAGYTSSVNGFTITNTHEVKKTSIDVEKVWKNTSNPPEIDVIIKLLADGEEVKTLKLNEDNEWKGAFSDLPVNKDGKAITYTIEEVEVSGYTTKITGSAADGFTVTNTKEGDRPNDEEEEDEPSGGPKDVTYTLKADKTLDGKKANGFTFQVKDADGDVVATASAKNGKITFPTFRYDTEGTYTYTVSEVAGTNTNITYDDSVYTLTVTVSKSGEELTAECTGLMKDGEAVESILFENTYDGERFYDDDEEELFEEDIPLGGLAAPETGDAGMLWALTAAVSGMGLAGLNFFPKKRKEDEE